MRMPGKMGSSSFNKLEGSDCSSIRVGSHPITAWAGNEVWKSVEQDLHVEADFE
jgi:hypothetical protein